MPSQLSGILVNHDRAGHVQVAIRTWGTRDSLVWIRLRDSLRTAVAGRLDHARPCIVRRGPADSAHEASAPNWTIDSLWRLPTYDLRLAVSGPKPGHELTPWSINLEAFVPPVVACGTPHEPAA